MRLSVCVIGLALASIAGCADDSPEAAGGDYPAATILYAAIAPHDRQLYIADGDGGNARSLLAEPGYDYNASLSADGVWAVFTSERDGSPDLYRARIDDSSVERLTDHPAFDDAGVLSPDGRYVAFVSTRGDGNANIWVLDLTTRTLTNLTAGSPGDYRPAWSPDSQWLVFSSIRDSTPLGPGADPAVDPKRFLTSNLYVIRRDGTGLRRLASAGSLYSPRWSPDGGHVVGIEVTGLAALPEVVNVADRAAAQAVVRETIAMKVVTIDITDGAVNELVQTPGFGGLQSPQFVGTSGVAYGTDQGIRFADGTPGTDGVYVNPSWSDDGRMMVFYRWTPTPAPTAEAVPPQGSPTAFKPHAALDPNFRVMRVGQFPSSRPMNSGELVMNNQMDGPSYAAILGVSPDGERYREIFRDPEYPGAPMAPEVSPDGEHIVFAWTLGMVSLGLPSTLMIMRSGGSELRPMPEAGEVAGHPGWSPDSTRIVFASGSPDDRGLRVLDVASGQVTKLTSGNDNFPDWSPVDDRIVFTRSPLQLNGASQVWSVRSDGTDLTQLTSSPGAQDAHPAWSPDGNWIAFASARINPREELIASGRPLLHAHHLTGQLFVMRADGADPRQLTDTAYNTGTPAWLPNVP